MLPISFIQKFPNIFISRKIVSSSCRFMCNEVCNATDVENADETNDPLKKDMPDLDTNPYVTEKVQCILCKHNIEPDFKNVRLLSQFQSRYTGRIYGKHITGLCKYKQEKVEQEIAKAQHAGLMGHFTKDPKYYNDPPLFNPNKIIKANHD